MRRTRSVGLAAAVCASSVLGVGTTAQAAAPTTVRVTFAQSGDEAKATPFAWAVRNLPGGGRVTLQRRMGTGGVWRDVQALRQAGRADTAPALAWGSYQLRAVPVDKHNRALAGAGRIPRVFGNVPVAVIFNATSVHHKPKPNPYPTTSHWLTLTHKTCKVGKGAYPYTLGMVMVFPDASTLAMTFHNGGPDVADIKLSQPHDGSTLWEAKNPAFTCRT